jgi:hypothetical protein
LCHRSVTQQGNGLSSMQRPWESSCSNHLEEIVAHSLSLFSYFSLQFSCFSARHALHLHVRVGICKVSPPANQWNASNCWVFQIIIMQSITMYWCTTILLNLSLILFMRSAVSN